MKKNTPSERLINGIIKENPTFVLMLGMCPTLAITTSAINAVFLKQTFEFLDIPNNMYQGSLTTENAVTESMK